MELLQPSPTQPGPASAASAKSPADPSAAKRSFLATSNEPTVRSIIESARAAPRRTAVQGAWVAAGLSGLLMWASFPPLDVGALGWIALVPLLLLIRPATRPRGTIVAAFVCGFLSNMLTVQWLRYGDPAMYLAVFAVALYFAFYPPLFVLLSRLAVHRLRIPFTLAVPVIWVGLDYFRAHFITGCSWYCLAHTQYRWIELIQLCDLVGTYGVSFLMAASAAALAGVIPDRFLVGLKLSPVREVVPNKSPTALWKQRPVMAVAFSLCLVSAALAYGYVRRAQAHFIEGPRIALIQGNFTSQVKHDPSEVSRIFDRHYAMTGDAVKFQPDIIVWPETMLREPLLLASPDLSDTDLQRMAPRIPVEMWRAGHAPRLLRDMCRQAGAAMIFGVETYSAGVGSVQRYNSAVLSVPGRDGISRYDKVHRVLFGEYIPLKETFPFLKSFVPFGTDFGIAAGQEAVAFDVKEWRLAPIICFEDTVPHLVRNMVKSLGSEEAGGKPVDCLVNLTNDGWFHGSSGLDSHLIGALFRCVECRKPMVRAVNTGISAVIDGDGIVIQPEVFFDADNKQRKTMRDPKTGRWVRDLNAVLVDSVPLDNRSSLYLRYGDWFASSCLLATVGIVLAGALPRRRFSRTDATQIR